jgi:alcohol dehydrogenase
MHVIAALENVGRNLARAGQDGNDIDAREKIAFGNTFSGVVLYINSTTSEHSLKYAMSAFHRDLPHGAGLIMISKAYFTHFINKHVCDERFIRMAQAMGMKNAAVPMDFITALVKLQEDCDVADLKMSDYGITLDELETLAKNVKETMDRSFLADRCELSIEDCVAIYKASYPQKLCQ